MAGSLRNSPGIQSFMRIAPAILAAGLAWTSCLFAQSQSDYQQDFDVAIREIAANYAYFDAQAHWNDVASLYATDLRSVKSRDEFVALLENVVDELYDPHAQLNTNLPRSFRLVPSGTDLWAEWQGGMAIITQVRERSDAQRAGIRSGAIVVSIDGVPIGRCGRGEVGTLVCAYGRRGSRLGIAVSAGGTAQVRSAPGIASGRHYPEGAVAGRRPAAWW